MNLKPILYILGGVTLTALVAAAKFAGGTPLDQTFTYQGQLRNAGQLVNGPVDLKISMWDADTGGSQVGSTNTFNAMQLNDGRFACGLNFGDVAFDGSNRWIEVEFRNPSGSGQYQTLSPRDKITATPYALHALNGGSCASDAKRAEAAAAHAEISALVAVEQAHVCQDSRVYCSVAAARVEAVAQVMSRGTGIAFSFPPSNEVVRTFSVDQPCGLIVNCAARFQTSVGSDETPISVELDGVPLQLVDAPNGAWTTLTGTCFMNLAAGTHSLRVYGSAGPHSRSGTINVTAVTMIGELGSSSDGR
jgi:hypothetical protein